MKKCPLYILRTLLKRFLLISVVFLVMIAVTMYELMTKLYGMSVVNRAKYPFIICKKNCACILNSAEIRLSISSGIMACGSKINLIK